MQSLGRRLWGDELWLHGILCLVTAITAISVSIPYKSWGNLAIGLIALYLVTYLAALENKMITTGRGTFILLLVATLTVLLIRIFLVQ